MKGKASFLYRCLSPILLRFFSSNQLAEWGLYLKYYSPFACKNNYNKFVIFALDGRTHTSGLADRLAEMISTYAYCKAKKLVFKIDHRCPFLLQDYLQPASYDWTIKPNEITYNILYSRPIHLVASGTLKDFLRISDSKQFHVYTNLHRVKIFNEAFGTNYNFTQLFNELFKPSDRLQKELDIHNSILGVDYISISFRFMQLLGDFKDQYGDVLDIDDRENLINKCLEQITILKESHKHVPKILVTTDSITFSNRVRTLPYVYVVPGNIGHIGYNSDDSVILKTFLDYWMISQAKEVYHGISGKMHRSGFAWTAAKIQNKPYHEIRF